MTGPLALALLAGVLGAVQPKLNAALGEQVGDQLLAALVNFAVALLLVGVALSLRPATRDRLRQLKRWGVPWWTMSAGLGGTLVVIAGVVAVERIGVAVFSVAFLAGQLVTGAVVDVLGLVPGEPRPLSIRRLGAVALAIVAVVSTQAGRSGGEVVPGLVVLAAASGGGVALQSAFNARIAAATGDPMTATALNVVVGAVAMSVSAAVASGGVDGSWPAEPWLYLGGACGFTIVLALAVATREAGALVVGVASVGAQLVAALGVDWVVDDRVPTASLVAGCVLVGVAVALSWTRMQACATRPSHRST